MKNQVRQCWACDQFSTGRVTEEQKAKGIALCVIKEELVAWNDRPCVLSNNTRHMSTRVQWVAQFQQKKDETNADQT